MGQAASIVISKLDHGYLVADAVFQDDAIAGCTTLEDLFEWIIFHFEAEEPEEAPAINPEPEPAAKPEAAPEAPVSEPDAEPEPEPEKPATKPVEKIDSTDPDEVSETQTIDRQAIQLMQFLDRRGAAKQWVKASYTDISKVLNITAPTIQPVIAHAKEKFPRLRVVRVMSGEHRGNNFTLDPDLPEPDAPKKAEPVKPTEKANGGTIPVYDGTEVETRVVEKTNGLSRPDLTLNQRAVLEHIRKCAAKNGSRFQINVKTLAAKSGCPAKIIYHTVGALKDRNFIGIEWTAASDPFITLLHQGHA